MSIFTFSLSINEEQERNKGEDSFVSMLHGSVAGMLACMDGCGGAGAAKYAKLENWSGAKIGARHAARALAEWFSQNEYGDKGLGEETAGALAAGMKKSIDAELDRLKAYSGEEEQQIFSKLARVFPSTLAGALAEVLEKNLCRAVFFWTGDSRVYLFRTKGLMQISTDDIRGGGDPYYVLQYDGTLSNVISASGNYEIHTVEMPINEPCMVMTATDGCFSYLLSPIQLEGIILDTLLRAETPFDWESRLKEAVGRAASDDYTLQIAVLGFSNFTALQNAYRDRWEEYTRRYAEPLAKVLTSKDTETHHELWLQYRAEYLFSNFE